MHNHFFHFKHAQRNYKLVPLAKLYPCNFKKISKNKTVELLFKKISTTRILKSAMTLKELGPDMARVQNRLVAGRFIRQLADESGSRTLEGSKRLRKKTGLARPGEHKLQKKSTVRANSLNFQLAVNNKIFLRKLNLQTKLEKKSQLRILLLKIHDAFGRTCSLSSSITSAHIAPNHGLIARFEQFRRSHAKMFQSLVADFQARSGMSGLPVLVLKFLLNALDLDDLRRMTPGNSYLMQSFLVNRFLRTVKRRLFSQIEESSEFGDFVRSLAQDPKQLTHSSSGLSNLEREGHLFSLKLSSSAESIGLLSSDIFDEGLVKALLSSSPKQPRQVFNRSCAALHRLTVGLIIRVLAIRFGQVGYFYDQIEVIETGILTMVRLVLRFLEVIRAESIRAPDSTRLASAWAAVDTLNEQLRWNKPIEFGWFIEYVRSRTANGYLFRKNKNMLARSKRNDEKLKKVYKNLIAELFEDYKKKELITENPVKIQQIQLSATSTESHEKRAVSPKIKNKEKHAELGKRPGKIAVPNKSVTPRRLNKLQMQLFYQFYFKNTAKHRNIPIEHFYDPAKTTLLNPKFKTFSVKYFKLLLQSELFYSMTLRYVCSDLLLVRILKRYSENLWLMLKSTPTALLDQYKIKAKFFWTSYELFFAVFFFRMKIGI